MSRTRLLLVAASLASLMTEAESETSTASGAAAASTEPPAADKDAAALEKKRTEIRNSHWCVHSHHGLGQIGEIGSQVRFHRYRMHSGDTSPSLDSEPVLCELADLRLATPEELPASLEYTPEQLKDLGYTS